MAAAAPRLSMPLFSKTLALSLLFHLSAITLFSVVLYFPKESIHYYKLALVQEAMPPETPLPNPIAVAMLAPRPAATGDAFSLREILDAEPLPGDEKLHTSGHSYFEDTKEPAPDSWAQFGRGIQGFRNALIGLNAPSRLEIGGTEKLPAPRSKAAQLGNNLRAQFEWGVNAPRELILQPAAFFTNAPPNHAMEFNIEVDASGAVLRATSLSASQSPFEGELQSFLRRCRFAAAHGDERENNVVVRVTPVSPEAAP